MPTPLIYILAPFALAFALFAVFLIVSIILRDPARPFRMFKAPHLGSSPESSDNPSTGSGRRSPEEEDEEKKSVKEQVH